MVVDRESLNKHREKQSQKVVEQPQLEMQKNLYRFDVDYYATLMGKADKVVSRDESELWHMGLGHLPHEALKVMQQISTELPKGTLTHIEGIYHREV